MIAAASLIVRSGEMPTADRLNLSWVRMVLSFRRSCRRAHLSIVGVLEVLDRGVRPRIKQGLMAGVLPTDQEGRRPFRASDLQHLAIAIWFSYTVAADDDAISDACLHEVSPFLSILAARPARPPTVASDARGTRSSYSQL
jgi:hypothetical protein